MRTILCAVAAVAFLAATVVAAEGVKEELQTVKGLVKVTKEGDKVSAIEIVTKAKDPAGKETEKAYAVQGEKSGDVAKLEGKEVEAKGVVAEKDGKASIVVKEVVEVKKEEKKS